MDTRRVSFTEVDGVPTYYSRGAGGPTRAMLQFRVGHADEDLPQRGITHMVEHLALHPLAGDVHHNGFTGPNLTGFVVEGDADRVRTFFEDVTRALRQLPVDRLEVERNVLRSEEAQRSRGLGEELLIWRYGLKSYGASASEEYGVWRMDEAELAAWSAEYFTRANAALWLTGEVPTGLRFDLPGGVRMPVPELVELQAGPSWYQSRYRGGAGSSLVRRSYATTAYAGLLDRRLKERLRISSGVSYAPRVEMERRDADWAEILFSADALEENLEEVAVGVVETIEEIKEKGFEPADLDFYRTMTGTGDEDPRQLEALAGMAAHSDLLGADILWSLDDSKVAVESVTLEKIHRVAIEAWDKILFAMPGIELERPGVARLDESSGYQLWGVAHGLRESPRGEKVCLTIGEQGITLTRGGQHTSVRFDEKPVLLAWDDGKRMIVGRDAFQVNVEPNIWFRGENIVAVLDGAVPDDRKIPMGSRDPSEVPAAPAPRRAPRTVPESLPYVLGVIGIVALVVVGIAARTPLIGTLALVLTWRLGRSWLQRPS